MTDDDLLVRRQAVNRHGSGDPRQRGTYGITNSEFKVLCAARLYRMSHKASFRPYQLSRDLPGMWVGQLYKSIRRLEQKGFISAYKGVGFKVYSISHKGESCLRSYAKVFDSVFYKHIQGLE